VAEIHLESVHEFYRERRWNLNWVQSR